MKKYIALLSIDAGSINTDVDWKQSLITSIKEALSIIWETDQFKKVGSLHLVNIVGEQNIRVKMLTDRFSTIDLNNEIARWMDTPISSYKSAETWTRNGLVLEAGDGDIFVIALLSKEGCRKIELSTLEVADIPTKGNTLISSIKVFD